MARRDRPQVEADWVIAESDAPTARGHRHDTRLADRLRRAALARVSGEEVVAEGRVLYLDRLSAARAFCIVSEERFVVAPEDGKAPRLEWPFSVVATVRSTMTTTTVTIADPTSGSAKPDGRAEREYRLYHGRDPALPEAFRRQIAAKSSHFGEHQRGLERFKKRRLEPLATWDHCPICEQPFDIRVEHVAFCSACRELFADPGYEPVIALTVDPFSSVLGAQPIDVDEDTDEATWVRPYCMLRQANDVFDGNVVIDRELEFDAAVDVDTSSSPEQRS